MVLVECITYRPRMLLNYQLILNTGTEYLCDGPVVRASASQSEGRGFEPRPSHTKDFKNGTIGDCVHPIFTCL